MKNRRSILGIAGLITLFCGVGLFLWFRETAAPLDSAPSGTASIDPIQIALQINDLAEAQILLENTLQQNPADAAVLYQLGLVLAVRAPDQAPQHLKQAATLDAAYAERSNILQNTLLRASLEEDAAYQMILIGQTLGALEEWRLAMVAFEQSIALDAQYAEAWAYLGEAQQQIGEEGLDALHIALSLDPESLSVQVFLGMYWRRNQRPDLALSYFEHADQLAPSTPAIQVEIGQTLVNAGEVQEALLYFQEAVALSPDQKEAWQTFAAYAIDNEIYVDEIGLPAARQALLLDQTNPYSLTLMGRAYALLQEEIVATRFYDQAIETAPDDAAAYYYLALLQLASSDQQAAQSNLIQAVQLDPVGKIGKMAQEVLGKYFP